jgi:predicted patatin/cPLA2 family phospholipase
MPVVSRPVRIGESSYLDGGIADAVPYRYMEEIGYGRNVIILTQPKGYRKRGGVSLLMKFLLRRMPKILEAMERRAEMYNRQMEKIRTREENGISFVIRPPEPLGISRTEHKSAELERVYQMGRREAEAALPRLQNFLNG